MNPRVKDILNVTPFKVRVKWTNGQIKEVDFCEFLAEERRNNHPLFSKLFDTAIFFKVKTDGRTLYWDALAEMLDENGKRIEAPLDFCPDVLYQISKEV